MRIHTRVVIDMASGEVLEDDWYEYDGDLAEAKGGGGEQTTTQSNEPSSLHRPYIQRGLQTALNQFQNQRPDYFPHSTVAPMNGISRQGMGMVRQLSGDRRTINAAGASAQALMNGNYEGADVLRNLSQTGGQVDPRIDAMLGATIGGDYLGGDQFMTAYGDDIMDQVNSQFAGRSGSAYHAQNVAKGLGTASAQLYSGERDRMLSAADLLSGRQLEGQNLQMNSAQNLAGNQIAGTQLAPQIESARYIGANSMMQAGAMQQQQLQNQRNAAVQRWDFNQNRPIAALDRYMNYVNGAPGGTTTTMTGGASRNPWTGAIGGAATGAAVGSMFGPPGSAVGAGYGAIAGGLGGYLWG